MNISILRSVLEGSDYLYCDETGAVFGDAGKCLADKCKAQVANGAVSTEKVGDYYVYAQVSSVCLNSNTSILR